MSSQGRFSKLDFEDKAAPLEQGPVVDPWPNLDEHGCLRMAEEQFDGGLYELALASYSRALRFNKDLSQGWVGQVRCLLCLGEYPEAITWSSRGLDRFPNSSDLLASKGLAMIFAGQRSEGMEFLDGAVQMKSPSAWVWIARGQGLLAIGQPAANATRCFMKAYEAAPEEWRVAMRIGMAYNRCRMFAQSRPLLLSAVRQAPGNPLLLYHLGVAHEGLGDRRAAVGYYERAVAARRDYPEASAGLTRTRSRGFKDWLRR